MLAVMRVDQAAGDKQGDSSASSVLRAPSSPSVDVTVARPMSKPRLSSRRDGTRARLSRRGQAALLSEAARPHSKCARSMRTNHVLWISGPGGPCGCVIPCARVGCMGSGRRSVTPVDGYIRVSRTGGRRGERFIAPEVQREQIESWAASRDFALVLMFEELDESGARSDRPLLREALGRIESGSSRGLVVSGVNRFGRSLIDGLVQVDRVRAAGGEFYSVQDGLDTSTPSGRLVLRIMLSMAEWELDRIRDDWRAATASAIARGVYVAGCVPVGYVKTRSGRLRMDLRTGPVIAEAFRRRAAGESLRDIGRYLESEGVLTGRGSPGWVPTTVSGLFRNRTYLGELKYGQCERQGAHPAIIDSATFALAQQAQELVPRELLRARRSDAFELLKGLVRCASCGITMVRVHPGSPTCHYICRKHVGAGSCPGPGRDRHQTARTVRPRGLLHAARTPSATSARCARRSGGEGDRMRSRPGPLSRQPSDPVHARRGSLRRRPRDPGSPSLQGRLGLAAARERVAAHQLPTVPELRAAWPTLDALEQRRMIRQVIDCVFVTPGRGHVEHRVTICPRGTGPAYGFRGVGPGNTIIPLTPQRRWINPTPGPSGRREFASRPKTTKPG
jgi:site-specific DNA recombinase